MFVRNRLVLSLLAVVLFSGCRSVSRCQYNASPAHPRNTLLAWV